MTEKDEIRRGEEAKRLLSEPLLVEAFQKIEEGLLARMKQVDVGATEAHRNLIVTLQLLGKVKQHLEQTIVSGEFAKREVDRRTWVDKLRRRA